MPRNVSNGVKQLQVVKGSRKSPKRPDATPQQPSLEQAMDSTLAAQRTSIPSIGEGKRGEQGYIGYLLRQAGNAHRMRMERVLSEFKLTLPQFSALTMLTAYPGASGAELARLSLLTPATMSVIINNLERDGAIARTPHSVHGRIQHIEVTATGRELLQACRAKVHAIEAAMLADLSLDEEVVVRRWLVRCAMDAGEMS